MTITFPYKWIVGGFIQSAVEVFRRDWRLKKAPLGRSTRLVFQLSDFTQSRDNIAF